MKIPQRRRRPAMQSPQWSDAGLLRQRLKESEARYAALAASLPERDRATIANTAAKLTESTTNVLPGVLHVRDQRTTERVMADLRERGLLREQPAKRGVIKTLIRNESGQVIRLTETAGQIEPPEDGAP